MSVKPHRTFSSTEHLAAEAVAAYVDGEMQPGAALRAERHLQVCRECLADVAAQQQARGALRQVSGTAVAAPSSLLGLLAKIPHAQGCGPDARKWTLPWRK